MFLFVLSVQILIIFTENLIEFNAEKLMLIYFLILFSIIIINLLNVIKFTLEQEVKKYILNIIELENYLIQK